MNEQDISKIIQNEHGEMELLTTQLLDHALDAGGGDNISIICINTQLNEG